MSKFKPGDIVWTERRKHQSDVVLAEVTKEIYKIVDVVWNFTHEKGTFNHPYHDKAIQVYIVDKYTDYWYRGWENRSETKEYWEWESVHDEEEFYYQCASHIYDNFEPDAVYNHHYDTMSISELDKNYRLARLELLVTHGIVVE